MQGSYTIQAKKALFLAHDYSKALDHGFVGTEHLLLGLLKEGQGLGGRILARYGANEEKILALIEKLISPDNDALLAERGGRTPRLTAILEEAKVEAARSHFEEIGTEHMLLALLKDVDSVGSRLLTSMNINVQKMYLETIKAMGIDPNLYRERLGLSPRRSRDAGSTLEQYSRDLTALARERRLDPVIGRDSEIQRLIQILSRRTKNNPCLIGEPGVGKSAIVEGLASRIADGQVPEPMKDKRVLTLDLSGMVAGSKYRGEFEERIKNVINEVTSDGSVLLFMDEVHTMIGAGGAEGAMDASNILKPSLSRGELQLIGATTLEEYRKYIEKDAALERRFQPIVVEEPTQEQAIDILKGLRASYEEHHKVEITDEGIEAAVRMSSRYINDRFLPDKAIDLIDEASSKLRLTDCGLPPRLKRQKQELEDLTVQIEDALTDGRYEEASRIRKEEKEAAAKFDKALKRWERNGGNARHRVDENTIAQIVSDSTKIPVQKLEESESSRLLKLESILHKRVIGQEEAVSAVSKAVKRGRVGLKDPNRPIGSFLFLGPTGVGKTELSKALAEALFGMEQAIIRVDMSEYMEKHSVSKLIGSPPGYVGYEEGGQLSEKVRRTPYSVILFDEIEKAHPDVFNILLQVLDDGHITDSQGRRVDFKNTVIIMTSNAGAQSIVAPKMLGFAAANDDRHNYEVMKRNVMEEVKRLFKPEFLNRIDETIVFHALNKEHVKKIAGLMLKELAGRAAGQMNLSLKFRPSVRDFIVEKGFDIKYGARPLKRAIQTEVEDALAEAILSGEVKTGDEVTVGVSNKNIKFYVNNGETVEN